MEITLEEEEEQSMSAETKNANISLPTVIIEEIFSRLPVKSILRFRTVSKPWLSRISDPSFTKLHFTHATAAHRTAVFIYAFDYVTRKRHFLSAPHDGGPLTHLITLDDSDGDTQAEHLNGLVFCTFVKWSLDYSYVFVFNPSTHRIFKLPDPYPDDEKGDLRYLVGFDESRKEHLILSFRYLFNPTRVQIMIFSMSTYSWRKIDAEPPIGFRLDHSNSVCVNSVVHLMLVESFDILAFDLRTEKFSLINTPQGALPHDDEVGKYRSLIKINGCIGVVCHDPVVENNEMHIWILQGYESRVWVREIITFHKPWSELGFPFPVDSVNMDEIIFSSSKFSENVMNVPVYNWKGKCFKSLQFTPSHQFWLSSCVRFNQIRCYVESMVPL